MSSTMAVSQSYSRPERMARIEREISPTSARADLMRLCWRPIQQRPTYDIEIDPTFEIEIPCRVRAMEIDDPCAFLQSFTHDPSVGRRIPQNRRRKMTFADFTKKIS